MTRVTIQATSGIPISAMRPSCTEVRSMSTATTRKEIAAPIRPGRRSRKLPMYCASEATTAATSPVETCLGRSLPVVVTWRPTSRETSKVVRIQAWIRT